MESNYRLTTTNWTFDEDQLEAPMQYLAVIRNTDTFDLHREDLIKDAIQLAVMLYRSNDFPSKTKQTKDL